MTRDTCVILVNYGRWGDTAACVESLAEYCDADVLVVDNRHPDPPAGTDPDLLAVRARAAEVIHLPENRGFGGGNNVGLRWTRARGYRYAWLLNTDTVVRSDALGPLRRTLDGDPAAAMCGSAVYHLDDPERLQFYGGGRVNTLTGNLMHARHPGERLDYLTATSVLLRLSVPLDFDETYFMYFEDAELGRAALQAGYTLRVAADSVVYHRESASSVKDSVAFYRLFLPSMRTYFTRHSPIGVGAYVCGVLVLLAKHILKRRWRSAGHLLRAVAAP